MSTATLTYADTLGKHDIDIPENLVAQAEVPVLTGPQRQGDVSIWPTTITPSGVSVPVPPEGIAVVRGETSTGSNSHILDAYYGDVYWTEMSDRDGLLLGIVEVPDGSVAVLTHTDEHGSNAIGPGRYELTGKREQADIVRRVAD